MEYLTASDVIAVHERVIHSHELQGCAANKSVESVVARIETRVHYGLIRDVFELAACYAVCLAVGHAFNDANKRTAFMCMDMCLFLNGIEIYYNEIEVGDKIREAAQGFLDENQLATWLRQCYFQQEG